MAVALLRVRLRHTTRYLSPLPRQFFSFSLFDSVKSKKRDSSPTLKDPPPPPPPNHNPSNDKHKLLFLFDKKINFNIPNTNTTNIVTDNDDWVDVQRQIIRDIEPICSSCQIYSSLSYSDGEHLTPDDEKAVVDGLLAYHPCSEDKIGCGLDSIMVDRHPQFTRERCLFVVRTDSGWTDFSYQKCLREYVRMKYPSHAERFEGEKLVINYERQQHKSRLWTTGRLS